MPNATIVITYLISFKWVKNKIFYVLLYYDNINPNSLDNKGSC